MSEENNNLGDDLKKGAEDALDSAKDAAKKATEKAGEFAEDAKDAIGEFADDAKEAASEFATEAKETFNEVTGENKKVLAGILGILFGSLGIHKFVLGYNKEGLIQIIISVVTCGAAGIIGLIEGIIYLTKSDEEFYQTYQVGRKPWF
ncbi:NINE protein [Aquimarina sp. 2201CG14-23]|uniref:NINE protein n=1 Tax=Aquimarina mycalae TaxID=3040073 RepID=UPI002478262A|nr:NINE protein [Aquimarina sp. 2201CG14-23]MDH7447512.1 NINE protein [Aquimarina sp. 2201CG14-23]